MDSVLVNIVRRVPKIGTTLVLCSLIVTWIVWAGYGRSIAGGNDPDIERVKAMAVDLERKSDSVIFLCEIAGEWATISPSRAKKLLEEAFQIANGLEESRAANAALGLRVESVWRDPDLKSQARHWADQVLDGTRPVGPYLALAHAWRDIDGTQVAAMAQRAARSARNRTDQRERDMGFRAAAVMLADVDPEQAEYLGLAIRTPEVRAWAFSSMARLVLVTDKTTAATWYGRAVDACLLITDAMERLRVLSGLAYVWHGLDPNFSEKLFRDGVRLANEFENSVERSRAFCVLGMNWGRLDSRKAFELAQMIPVEYPEARLDVYLAGASEASRERDFQGLIMAAHREARAIKTPFEREKALSRIAILLAPESLDAALEIYDELRPGNRWLRDEVAGAIVKAAADWNIELAAELAEQVENPELEASLTALLAAELASTDSDRARSLLEKAVKAVEDRQVEVYAPDVIEILAMLDPAAAMSMVCETWPVSRQVSVWNNIARTFERRGQSLDAQAAWNRALGLVKENNDVNGLRAAEMYRKIARAMMDVRSRQADDVYEMACQAVAGWMKGAEKRN